MAIGSDESSYFGINLLPFLCIISILLLYVWRQRPNRFPRGPMGFPLVGTLPFLYHDPPRVLRDWSTKNGDVMSVRMGRNEVVVLSGYKTIYEAFVTSSDCFSGRPFKLVMHKIFHRDLGISFLDYHQRYKSQRQFGVKALRGVGIGRRSLEDRVMEEMEYLVESLLKKDGKPFNLRFELTSAAANIIMNILLGRRFEYKNPELVKLVNIFDESFSRGSIGMLFYMTMFESWLRLVPPFRGAYLKISKNLDELRAFVRRQIEVHAETFDKNDLRDFCDAFYAEMTREGGVSNGYFEMDQLVHYIQDLLVAGFETSTSTLLWAVLCLLHKPRSQDKIFGEIKEVIGESGVPRLRHRASMPYTMSFIEETLRYRAVVPIIPSHKTTSDVELNGFVIPKNTEVIANMWSVQHDPDLWEKPEEFRPERHLTTDGKFTPSDKILAFSVGPRRCPGEDIAKTEIFLFLVTILQKFVIGSDPDSKTPPSVDNGSHASAFVPAPFDVVLQPRH